VVLYRDDKERVPVLDWLKKLRHGDRKGHTYGRILEMAKTKDALKILDRVTGDDPHLRELIEEETLNAHVARLIYEARTAAGLTQQQLADLVGTKQPDIARLEDADYQGHSLTMLQRIAAALDQRLEIAFAPAGKDQSSG
jgi:ribosome-binding protein aMBF1 (putative translation factor)